MKAGIIAVILVVLGGLYVAGLGIEGEMYGLYSPMGNVNALVDQHEVATSTELPELHVGTGGAVRIGLLPVLGAGTAYVGGRGALYAMTERDTQLRTAHVGLVAGVSYSFGGWMAAADVGAYRGTFEFASARYPVLSGWTSGISSSVGYRLSITSSLSVGAAAVFQWIPFYRMTDREGQTYRGRGTPFVDFEGIGGSIHLVWEF